MDAAARLLDMPLALAFLIVVGLPTLWTIGGVWLIRRRWSHTVLQANNEVAGFVYAAVGVLYAAVLAFVFIAVWEQYSDTEKVVESEASALASLYRQVQVVFPQDQEREVRKHVYLYTKLVAEDEWHEMEKGVTTGSEAARAEYNAIWDAARLLKPTTASEANWHSAVLDRLNEVSQNRRIRLTRSSPESSSPLWPIMILGGVLTVGYTFLFGMRHVHPQMIMGGILAALIALILFAIFAMENPFRGAFRIHSYPFEREVVSFERQMRAQNIPFPSVPH